MDQERITKTGDSNAKGRTERLMYTAGMTDSDPSLLGC
jgi:hypothetical protein